MAHRAWSCVDWQDGVLLPFLAFADLANVARTSRGMRQLVAESSNPAFMHYQRGARLCRELNSDLETVLQHSAMPPRFVRECLYGWAFLNYIASRDRKRVELDLQGMFAHAYASGVAMCTGSHWLHAIFMGTLAPSLLSIHLDAYATSNDARASDDVATETAYVAARFHATRRE